MVKKRIEQLRKLMDEKGIYAYIIPSSDFHQSEYVGEYFKSREFITGFTGSAGTAVITKDDGGLWTDGRYYLQAEKELEKSGIKLFKSGLEGVPEIEDYLKEVMPENSKLGFDGKVISVYEGEKLQEKLRDKNIKITYEEDLIDIIWKERISMSDSEGFLLDVKYVGEDFVSKLSRVREVMKEKKSTMHIIAALDDIAWLFNIRGRDVKYNPVILSYAVVALDDVYLFIDENKLTDEMKVELNKGNTIIKSYFDIYEFVKEINIDEKVLLDKSKVNYAIYNNIPSEVEKINESNPTMLFKAVKNEVELDNIRKCHIRDGVAMTKFMYWVKNNVGKIDIDEVSIDDKLLEFRSEQENFIEPSFNTIAGYKDHGAIIHYSATKETAYKLKPEGLLLVDSGGQYYDGTTDITRMYVLGEIPEIQKTHFTAVARGMIKLSMAKFMYGCRGYNLDILARGPLWEMGLDYRTGTGHGIGFVLNVHEAPNGFRWKIVPERNDSCILEAGMVTTNEPGIYIDGSHGIRIENELITIKGEATEYGQFMEFEAVTLAPIDLDGINPELMERKEIEYLNNYHKKVYEEISPFLNEDEKEWLKKYTRAI
ncbi:aminopeptidase P family protein [Romboutsia ilealis]|uniref:Aminopeptidase P family protein n=1 Tax=Romboutsia faecis TaxID=2764597 RepID=A0ABR7JR30_9FIRM|nr:aminopeptidase P family protein [Romboutsia faecis]MBC5997375.1 aminopeptidase P family protein [Romboutsia faecis]MRN23657.1 aminopeptidase P family protein [Romboutsia ilealis]